MLADTFAENRIESALAYLESTDSEYAKLKSDVERTKHNARRAEALEILSCTVGTAQIRKAISEVSDNSNTAWNKHYDAIEAFERLKVKRENCVLLIDIWRTYTSARKQGVHI